MSQSQIRTSGLLPSLHLKKLGEQLYDKVINLIQLTSIKSSYLMSHIACRADGTCPYQYTCTKNTCVHDSVFPITGYPIAIYCLFPLASAICNVAGNSFGQFKVLFLMVALNYSQSAATTLCYPLILGTALFNFFRLIFNRHPSKQTTIVDYNIVMIIIPCVLYGSTIGSLVNNFIPPIVADCLIIALLTLFTIKFLLKLKALIRESKLKQEQKDILTTESAKNGVNQKGQVSKQFQLIAVKEQEKLETVKMNQKSQRSNLAINGGVGQIVNTNVLSRDEDVKEKTDEKQLRINQSYREQIQNSIQNKTSRTQKQQLLGNDRNQGNFNLLDSQKTNKLQLSNPYHDQLQKQLQYEKTHHIPDVLKTVALFIVFQTAAFLAQGKIIPFGLCSKYYSIGMGVLSVFFIIVMVFIYFITNKKIKYYEKIGYDYEYPLNKIKYFGLICIGSLLGGFNGGVFALGNSPTIILALLYLEIQPIVAIATVGFQVVFAAAASLCEALVRGTIAGNTVVFFFLLTLVGGGIISFIAFYYVGKLNRQKVNIVLVGTVAGLTLSSSISMIINIALGYTNFGAAYMIQTPPFC